MGEPATELAAFAAELGVAALPGNVLDAVRNDMLDTVGCGLAGATAPGIRELTGVLEHWGGRCESSVWGRAIELPAPAAALANGAAAHALDYDDTHDGAVLHAGAAVVPAAFAAAQMRSGATGDDVVAAVAAGVEIACRLGAAVRDGPSVSGWLLTPLCGTFGAAAAAARALALGPEATLDALGIAYSQCAGNGQATLDAALTKRLQPGFAARAGVLSATLAAAGITGARNVFEGERGWFRVYHRGAYDRDVLMAALGSEFLCVDLHFKPYPCCRWMHAAIDGALALRERCANVRDLERVEVRVSRQAMASTGRHPSGSGGAGDVVEAQFSIPYVVAVALLDGPPTLRHFTSEAVRRQDVLALARRVDPMIDGDPARASGRGISSASLTAHFRDGSCSAVEIAQATPVEGASLLAKFREACAYADIGEDDADRLGRRLLRAEGEQNADALARAIGRPVEAGVP